MPHLVQIIDIHGTKHHFDVLTFKQVDDLGDHGLDLACREYAAHWNLDYKTYAIGNVKRRIPILRTTITKEPASVSMEEFRYDTFCKQSILDFLQVRETMYQPLYDWDCKEAGIYLVRTENHAIITLVGVEGDRDVFTTAISNLTPEEFFLFSPIVGKS